MGINILVNSTIAEQFHTPQRPFHTVANKTLNIVKWAQYLCYKQRATNKTNTI